MNIKLRIGALIVAVIIGIACNHGNSSTEWVVVNKSQQTDAQTRDVKYLVRCRATDRNEEKVVTVRRVRWDDVEPGQRCPGT